MEKITTILSGLMSSGKINVDDYYSITLTNRSIRLQGELTRLNISNIKKNFDTKDKMIFKSYENHDYLTIDCVHEDIYLEFTLTL
jgi:hypothetical protein